MQSVLEGPQQHPLFSNSLQIHPNAVQVQNLTKLNTYLGLVSSVLVKYLGQYVDGINKNEFKLGLWSGAFETSRSESARFHQQYIQMHC
jgi:hypothetical protein